MEKVIVVEGKNDAIKIKHAYPNLPVLTTNGSAITDEFIKMLKDLSDNCEIILILDPDFPGEKIRKKIIEAVPNAKNVFVNKVDAISKNKKKIGVEHVSIDILRKLIDNPVVSDYHENITLNDLFDLGLVGIDASKAKRDKLCEDLAIGYVNAKQLVKRLNLFNITLDKVKSSLELERK